MVQYANSAVGTLPAMLYNVSQTSKDSFAENHNWSLVAPSSLEFRILVEILRILDLHDQNALLPEHLQGRNCLSDSEFLSKIPSNFVDMIALAMLLHINLQYIKSKVCKQEKTNTTINLRPQLWWL